MLVQPATLSQTATIQSLSFYINSASGFLRLGIYDSSGAGGLPGSLLATTAEITPVVGWNTASVLTPVQLSPGTYWLAYAPSSNSLGFPRSGNGGPFYYYSRAYGPMPGTFDTSSPSLGSGNDHWSFYATLLGPTPTPTP